CQRWDCGVNDDIRVFDVIQSPHVTRIGGIRAVNPILNAEIDPIRAAVFFPVVPRLKRDNLQVVDFDYAKPGQEERFGEKRVGDNEKESDAGSGEKASAV